MATIKIHCIGFPPISISNIDISTINWYGPTDGYDHPESKDYSSISFVVDNAEEIAEKIRKTSTLNPEYADIDDYIWVRTKFDEYTEDKRPRIGIRMSNGSKGMLNPPQFSIIN